MRWVVWGAERPRQGKEGQGWRDSRGAMTQRWPWGVQEEVALGPRHIWGRGREGPAVAPVSGSGATGRGSVRGWGGSSFGGLWFGFGSAGEGREPVAGPVHPLSSHSCRD